jgi:hypothetical protein
VYKQHGEVDHIEVRQDVTETYGNNSKYHQMPSFSLNCAFPAFSQIL